MHGIDLEYGNKTRSMSRKKNQQQHFGFILRIRQSIM